MNPPAAIDSLLVHADFVRRIAEALVGRAAAEDLCQETWVAALQHPPADASKPRSWLSTVVHNLFRDERRRQLRQSARERGAAVSEPFVPAAAEIVAREELRRQVVAAVMALPSELRDVVLLRYYEDLDSAAIGARLGRPAGTVRWQLHRAVQQLRRRLDGEHGERRAWAVPLSWWAKAQLGTVGAVFKVVWPVRAAVAAVLLLAIGWLALPQGLGASPPPLLAPLPVASASPTGEAAQSREAANERQPGLAAAAAHGADQLWGRVVRAADGSAVEGAEVQLQYRDADEFTCNDLQHAERVDTLATVRTDAEGRFAFAVAPMRLHRLHVRAQGLGPRTVTQCRGGRECNIELAVAASVEGVVREAGTGRALAGVAVRIGGDDHVVLTRSMTAPDGTFRLMDLPAAKVHVSVSSPEYEGASETRELQPGAIVSLQFELVRGRTVTGRVVDAVNGSAIAGASVADMWVFSRAANTDGDGRYSLGGVMQRSLYARADGYADASVALPAAATTLDFALVRGSSVRGRLVDERGMAIGRGYVAAIASFMVTQGVMDEDWRPCEVGDDGVFCCAQLDPRRQYGLYARGPGRGARSLPLPGVLVAGQVLDVGDVVLLPEARIEGRVVGSDGRPRGAARLQLGVGDDANRDAQTVSAPWRQSADGEGRFCISGLAAGSYTIMVQDDSSQQGLAFGPYGLGAGEMRDGLELVIPTGLSVSGRLVAPGGATVPAGFELFFLPGNGARARWTSSGAGGSFRFEGLDQGDGEIGCIAPAKGWSMSPVANVAAGAQELEIVVFPAASIRGRVVDRDGKASKAKLHATALGTTTRFFRAVETDADGSFTLEVAPDFVGTVWASDPENMFRQTKAENVAAGASDLLLQLW